MLFDAESVERRSGVHAGDRVAADQQVQRPQSHQQVGLRHRVDAAPHPDQSTLAHLNVQLLAGHHSEQFSRGGQTIAATDHLRGTCVHPGERAQCPTGAVATPGAPGETRIYRREQTQTRTFGVRKVRVCVCSRGRRRGWGATGWDAAGPRHRPGRRRHRVRRRRRAARKESPGPRNRAAPHVAGRTTPGRTWPHRHR